MSSLGRHLPDGGAWTCATFVQHGLKVGVCIEHRPDFVPAEQLLEEAQAVFGQVVQLYGGCGDFTFAQLNRMRVVFRSAFHKRYPRRELYTTVSVLRT